MLELIQITKAYSGAQALSGVSLRFDRGESVAVVGENGAGKSTLLNIASGIVAPDTGQVTVDGSQAQLRSYKDANELGIWRVFQDPALIPALALYENIFLGYEHRFMKAGWLNRRAMIRAARHIVHEMALDVDVRQPALRFTAAVKQAVEVAKAGLLGEVLGLERAYVLLDEPTTGLTTVEVERLHAMIRALTQRGVGIVYVSHRLTEVLEMSDRIYVLKDGALVAETQPQQTSEDGLHQLMVGRVRDEDYYLEHEQGAGRTGDVIIAVRGASKFDVRRGGKGQQRFVFSDVSFDLHAGEILGLGGLVGSGKTVLARCLAGAERLDQGTITVGGRAVARPTTLRLKRLGIAYVPGDRKAEGVIGTFSVAQNISLPSGDSSEHGFSTPGGIWRSRYETREAKRLISDLAIKATPGARAAHLSGGNQQKVVLAKWMRRQPLVFVAENPTSGVDVGAKMEIYRVLRALAARGTAILLVSDDLLELIGMSDRIAVMSTGRISAVREAPVDDKPTETELVALMTRAEAVAA